MQITLLPTNTPIAIMSKTHFPLIAADCLWHAEVPHAPQSWAAHAATLLTHQLESRTLVVSSAPVSPPRPCVLVAWVLLATSCMLLAVATLSRTALAAVRSRPIDWKPDTTCPPSPFKPSSTLRLGGMGTTGYISHVASGGNPMAAFPDDPRGQKERRPEFDSPCGSPTHPVVSKADACRPLPPYEPSSTLRLGGMGTNGHILHEASGGNPPVASPDGPCDLLRLAP